MGERVDVCIDGVVFKKHAVVDIAAAALTTVTGTTYSKAQLQALEASFAELWRTTWQPKDDTSFYATPEYAWLTLHCWRTWSASTMNSVDRFRRRRGFEPKRILDFGAGIGLTTLQLASMFPAAQITYVNLPCLQADVARLIFDAFKLQNVKMTTPDELRGLHHDTVVAVEVMEHIKDPGSALRSIIDDETIAYIDASSFAIDMAGHYESYSFGGVPVHRSGARKAMSDVIKDMGFVTSWSILPGDARMYHGMPTVYLRPKNALTLFKPAGR